MIIGIIGLEGTGKTLLGVILSTVLKKTTNYKVMTNVKSYKYNDYDFESDFIMLIEKTKLERYKKPERILVFIDEIVQYLDSRESMKPINKKLTRRLMQIRKYGFDMIYTAQLLMSADIRLRRMTDTFIVPDYDEHTYRLEWTQTDMLMNSVTKKSIIINPDIYKLYNTFEDIDSYLNIPANRF